MNQPSPAYPASRLSPVHHSEPTPQSGFATVKENQRAEQRPVARSTSPIETAKMNGIRLHACLKATLETVAGRHLASSSGHLMP